ncbi:MAG: NAD-dependent epimerase/dehydratase family protein [Planctomycetota bacterium]|jgi:GDP-L-fucose synthase
MAIDLRQTRIVVTGGAGFLGRVVCRKLEERGCREVHAPRRADYDLCREDFVRRMYADLRPDVVLHLAAEVGGIGVNMENPGRFFYANMAMAMHLIEHARLNDLGKFNAPYGVAKKAALVMLDGYRRQYGLASAYVLPANLYGPGDNFDLHTSHVIAALIRKCVEAVERGDDVVACWGTGMISREFLYVDDAAEAIVRAAERVDEPVPINVGTGSEIRIRDLAGLIARLAGFEGELRWEESKPDGQPRRCLDTQRAEQMLDWKAEVSFEDGLRRTVERYRASRAAAGSSQ